jgi:outer membrane protein assembly factor BamD
MYKIATVVLIVLLGLGSSGFAAPSKVDRKKDSRYKCESQFAKAQQRYARGRFNEVATVLDEIRYQCSGHRMIDTVLYYLGMSMLQAKRPLEAQTEFERLIQNYPNSSYYSEAQFRLGQSIWNQSHPYDRDQSVTHTAIGRLNDFIELYPASPFADSARQFVEQGHEKLAHKVFATARFYEKQEEYEAAIVYYNKLLAEYPESKYAVDVRITQAELLLKAKRITEALDIVTAILAEQPSEELARKATELKERLQKAQ